MSFTMDSTSFLSELFDNDLVGGGDGEDFCGIGECEFWGVGDTTGTGDWDFWGDTTGAEGSGSGLAEDK